MFVYKATLSLKIFQPTLNFFLKNRTLVVEYKEKNLPFLQKWKRNGQNVDEGEFSLQCFQLNHNLNVPVNNYIFEEKTLNLLLKLDVNNFRPMIG